MTTENEIREADLQLKELRQDALPAVGSVWMWEPDKPHARSEVRVEQVKWNGDEWWVLARSTVEPFDAYWNSLMRWIEATVMVAPSSQALSWPGPTPPHKSNSEVRDE